MLPASRLAFASAPQVIGTGVCSAPVIVESRNTLDQPTAVVTNTTVLFNIVPGMVSVYAGAGCVGGPVVSGVIPTGSSQVRFSVRSSVASSYTLAATSSPLVAATHPLTVFQLPTELAFTALVPSPLRAGLCLAASVESRGPSMTPLAVQSDTVVLLSTSVANGSLFFTDATCTMPATSVTIRTGNSVANVFVKPLSGVPQTLSATAPFGVGTLSIAPVPIVRRGFCTVRGSNELCPIDPVGPGVATAATAGRSFLITQSISTSGTSTPLDVEARCRLQGLNVNCSRRGGGLSSDASTHFQVVELPSGLTVQAMSNSLCSTAITLPAPVDLSRSFLLKSVIGIGSNFDQDDAVSVTLSSPTTATLSSNACEGYDVQAVQWDGVSVTRGQSSIGTGFYSSSVTLPPASPSTLVLSQPSNDATFSAAPCLLLGRAEVFSSSELRFFRGSNRATCNFGALPRIVWERIDFGARARVWAYPPVTLTMNTQTFSIPITTVDPTRSFVITSSQQLGGQGSGESDALGTADAADSAVQTRLISTTSVTATAVEIVRQASGSAAIVNFYVVQIDP